MHRLTRGLLVAVLATAGLGAIGVGSATAAAPITAVNDVMAPVYSGDLAMTRAAVVTGEGFRTFNANGQLRNRSSYVVRLRSSGAGNIETYRATATWVAQQVAAASGVSITVAAGSTGDSDAAPATGEIALSIRTQVCAQDNASGCGGPYIQLGQTESTVTAGRIWMDDSMNAQTENNRRAVLAHEMGHALGLDHFEPDYQGARQLMYPYWTSGQNPGYQAGDQNGLRYLRPAAATKTVRQIYGTNGGWVPGNTGVVSTATMTSGVRVGSLGWPQLMTNENGTLHQVAVSNNQWLGQSTGVSIGAGSPVSAVHLGGAWPQVMVNQGGTLMQVTASTSGWAKGNTGISIPAGAPISAVNMGGTWPQVMVNENGTLMQVYGTTTGWKKGNTGISVPTGASISAVNMGGTWPQVMVNDGGVISQVYGTNTGWKKGNTGISVPTGASISAVNMGGTWPQVMVNENGTLMQVYGTTTGWKKGNTGVALSTGVQISAVNMGGTWPQVMTAS